MEREYLQLLEGLTEPEGSGGSGSVERLSGNPEGFWFNPLANCRGVPEQDI